MTAFQWIDGVGGEVVGLTASASRPSRTGRRRPATTIVMLHEGLGCVALWRDFPAKLAAATGHGVFAYSRAGYGGSERIDLPRPLDYMSLEARFSLPAVLQAIRFERGILLGHSDGASIAAIYAGEHSDSQVKGLVLVAPHMFTEGPGLASIAEARRAYETGDLRAKLADITPMSTSPSAAGTTPGSTRLQGLEHRGCGRPLARPSASHPGRGRSIGTLKQIRAIGARSPAPVTSLILEACRHSPQNDQPQATLDAIVAFCARAAKA